MYVTEGVVRSMRKGLLIPLGACLTVLAAALAQYELSAQSQPAARLPSTKLTLGEFLVDPPTLINLGFEWFVDGDDNRNAAVAVSYRKHGTTAWHDGLPLMRVQHERITNGQQLDVIAPNMFAGSVLDLEPDTEYDVRFVASDPDGVVGTPQKVVSARTRKEPQPATDGRVFHVYPPGFKGQKSEPGF